jgi:hypothetical protein
VRVAFGTGTVKEKIRGAIDLIIESDDDRDRCGLPKPTRFDLETIAILSWEPPECDCWRGFNSPVLGSIPKSKEIECISKLAAIQNKQQA